MADTTHVYGAKYEPIDVEEIKRRGGWAWEASPARRVREFERDRPCGSGIGKCAGADL